VSAQTKKPAAADAKEILGRWVGSVTAEMGEMQFALDLKESDGKITGTLETMHGDWSVSSATAKDGKWTIVATAEDGTGGKLIGRVKDGKLAGDWDFAPRAVGTFQLARPSTRQ
jgi:hypothetical protein